MPLLRLLILLLAATPLCASPSFADESAADVTEQEARILFISKADCSECDRELKRLAQPGGTFDALRKQGWRIGTAPDSHIQLVDAAAISEQIAQWEVKEFPAVLCVAGDEIVRSFRDGCSTPLDVYTFAWLLKGYMERPKPETPTNITVETSGSYPLRGNHWNFEGNWSPGHEFMVSHLRGVHHVRLFPQSWPIESWSDEELRSLHDDLHEMNRPRMPLAATLEPGNALRPGEAVPVYRPAYQQQNYVQQQPKSSAVSAGATNAATKSTSRSTGYSRSSGSGFF